MSDKHNIASEIINLKKPIVLLGMMGSGKTTVGKRLAQKLDREFLDSDHKIVDITGHSIPDIFKNEGEAAFRKYETQAIKMLLDETDTVLATGGGAVITPENMDMIKSKGVSIWLDVSLEVLWGRLKNETGRPLLKTANPKETLGEIMKKRIHLYQQADYTVSADEPQESVVNAILDILVMRLHQQN